MNPDKYVLKDGSGRSPRFEFDDNYNLYVFDLDKVVGWAMRSLASRKSGSHIGNVIDLRETYPYIRDACNVIGEMSKKYGFDVTDNKITAKSALKLIEQALSWKKAAYEASSFGEDYLKKSSIARTTELTLERLEHDIMTSALLSFVDILKEGQGAESYRHKNMERVESGLLRLQNETTGRIKDTIKKIRQSLEL